MRDYATVSPRFWIGQTGRALRGHAEAQLVAIYLMTSPHSNMLGIFYCPVAIIALETGLSIEGASKGLRRASEGGFCTYDEHSEHVWVHEMARFQVAEELKPGDNRVPGIAREYAKLPNLPFLSDFFDKYAARFHLKERRCFEAPTKPPRSQEQEQEQEQEQDQEETPPNPLKGERADSPDLDALVEIWNTSAEATGGPSVRTLTATRRTALKARIKEYGWDRVVELLRSREHSAFLRGESGRESWAGATFDWVLKPTNAVKILEGNFRDQSRRPSNPDARVGATRDPGGRRWSEEAMRDMYDAMVGSGADLPPYEQWRTEEMGAPNDR